MPKKDTNASKMPGHSARTKKGRLRKIRSDTQMGTLEDRYDTDFGVRSDMNWGTYKKQTGAKSVRDALRKNRK